MKFSWVEEKKENGEKSLLKNQRQPCNPLIERVDSIVNPLKNVMAAGRMVVQVYERDFFLFLFFLEGFLFRPRVVFFLSFSLMKCNKQLYNSLSKSCGLPPPLIVLISSRNRIKTTTRNRKSKSNNIFTTEIFFFYFLAERNQ